jgi:plastocyanin
MKEIETMANWMTVTLTVRAFLALALGATVVMGAPSAARAAPDGGGTTADVARLAGDVDRLKQELRDQRQLIFQLMQAEQQRYEVILKYLQAGGAPGEGIAAIPPPPSPASLSKSSSAAPAGSPVAKEAAPSGHELGTISGRVRTNGQPIGEVYVYVDGIHAAPVRGHTLEIKQRDKQFAPRVAVVPVGTRLIFPNQDTVIHNVFSQSAGNSFDLGSVKGGETSAPVVLLKSGPVEIFCNIHSKMRSDLLVVPNGHWTRVAADGSFQLSGVPAGTRKIVLWSPTLKPVSEQVDVTAKGGTAIFSAEASGFRPHMNKRGQAYGSYDE